MFGTKILEEKESKYNGYLKVSKTFGLGTYIQANGLTQSGGIVSTIWKSTLSKIRNSKLEIRNVLILGLGGGTVAKLVKKYWPASPNRGEPETRITGVDIDPVMVELGKKYLGLNKIDVDTKITDAYKYVEDLSKIPDRRHKPKRFRNEAAKWDLIIVDLYNGDKFPEKFESENYIHLVSSLLSRSGFAVFNRLYYGEKRPEAVRFGNKLQKVFSNVEWFYPEANLMFICKI